MSDFGTEDKMKQSVEDDSCKIENPEIKTYKDHNAVRTTLRAHSKISCNVLESMQPYLMEDNLKILLNLLKQTKNTEISDRLRGLIAILETLLVHMPCENGQLKRKSFMTFEDAFNLFKGYQTRYIPGFDFDHDRKKLKEQICHPKHGIAVYIIDVNGTSYIVLKPKDIDLASFFQLILSKKNEEQTRLDLSNEFVSDLINSVDTEWDKIVAKVILCHDKSQTNIKKLGMDPSRIPKLCERVKTVVEDVRNTNIAAGDLVTLRLREKIHNLETQISSAKDLLAKKIKCWKESIIESVEEEISLKEDQLNNARDLMANENAKSRNRLQRMKRRQAQQLVAENRVKKRRLSNAGSLGAPRLLDSDDETFIAKCIEDKATYHGRRHDLTMYTNRRVKKKDLLNIANYRLSQQNKKLIKSATTVYNRSKAKNIRSSQASKHIGKGLFCCKKPPKAEDRFNENTHYQRAHVNMVKHRFFSKATEKFKHLCFMRSTDDKAYLRPGTSEGFEKTRYGKILTLTDINKARKLPKYDWPEKLVYQTPASHRIFTKSSVLNPPEKEKLITDDDFHFVFVRPKAIVPSGGSVWASETVRLRQEQPDVFEVKDNSVEYSLQMRTTCAMIHDAAFLYEDMTTELDLRNISAEENCKHKSYELQRLKNLQRQLEKSMIYAEKNLTCDSEKTVFAKRILPLITSLNITIEETFETVHEEKLFISGCQKTSKTCNDVIKRIKELKLPSVKPYWADLTDAGPGVGVSNFEVRFRDAELARLYNSDLRCRVHRSREDSGQNEAERTNSAIADSVVDGGTINWETEARFQGMSLEDIESMSLENYDIYEKERMERNAWKVAREVTERIDGAPVLSDFIKAYVSHFPEDMFFFNTDLLHKYNSAGTQKAKDMVPGSGYIHKILNFIDSHYIFGELFMEYVKNDCEKSGTKCNFCKENNWSVGPVLRIPQPMPDQENPGHYLPVDRTPLRDATGLLRKPDDMQPRANLKIKFKNGEIDANNLEAIEEFSQKYFVEEIYVTAYLQHLQNLKNIQDIRSKERVKIKSKRSNKRFEDYNWMEMITDGRLKTLNISELDKYLDQFNLLKNGKKADKIKRIMCHGLRSAKPNVVKDRLVDEISEEETESDSDGDEIIQTLSDSEEEIEVLESEKNDSVQQNIFTTVTTRGRKAGSWRNAFKFMY